jgi:6-pyruvoyltetrahydropterin/6-carboxytetrahydropterin synthase
MGDAVYEVGTAAGVRAFHVMPGMEGPEGELHAHDYRIDLVVRRDELSPEGWVCDLDVLDAALREITQRLEGSDLDAIRPEEAEAVTVEVFARWVHDTLSAPVARAGGETLAVRVWESPVAFGGFAGPVAYEPAASSP